MTELLIATAGLFGLIVGSFLNVLILRMHTGRGPTGRSSCSHCGHVLTPGELVPVFSFLWQRGRCRECRSKLPWQYPLVEALTAVVFALIAWRVINPISLQQPLSLGLAFTFLALIFSLLIVIVVYDGRHFIIPDRYVFLFIGSSFLTLFIDSTFTHLAVPTALELAAGPLAAAPFAFLWLISQGKWMGFGDAKLALGIGWFLKPYEVVSALLLAFWIGAVYGVLLLLVKQVRGKGAFARWLKQFTIESEVPFAPFLVLGLALVFFFHIDVLLYFLLI